MERSTVSDFRFSSFVTDLVQVLGYKQSAQHADELSKESNSQLNGASQASLSESAFTRITEKHYASINIDEGSSSMAEKIRKAKQVAHSMHREPHNRIDDLSDHTSIYNQARHTFVPIEPPSYFGQEHHVKILANPAVSGQLSERLSLILDHMTKESESEKPATHELTGVSYLADFGNDTIDLVGEPAIKNFFSGFKTESRDPSPKPISTGTDFHKAYVPPVAAKKSSPAPV